MERGLQWAFGDIKRGDLTVVTASGRELSFGNGTGTPVRIRFTDRGAQWAFLLDPDLKLGELFMDGRLIVEQGSIYDFLEVFLASQVGTTQPPLIRAVDRIRFAAARIAQNGLAKARMNVASHYDLDARLYDLFLDADRQYSCAYYETPDATLEEAQRAKLRHIAAKLAIGPADRVLDIGCGWGGMSLYLAGVAGAREVLGVTLSEEQIAIARKRAVDDGLSDRVSFALQDYRNVEGRFDRIVSVGMFEHVGFAHYRTFFEKCHELLADDGVMLLHTIGISDGPDLTNPWLTKHIFPGGALPALSQMLPVIERAGLMVTDIEVLRLHYAFTLRAWRERFLARRDEAARLYDERFVRMWEFYLSASETAFRYENVVVFQIQLTRRQEAVPLTRDYLAKAENALRFSKERRPTADAGDDRRSKPAAV